MTEQALVFDVQRFSVHDGPGIRTTVFFKGCPLRCAWCQNPESMRIHPELAFHADRCHRTAACIPACPKEALATEGVRVDRERCDVCGECVDACPHGALRVVGRSVGVDELLDEVSRDRTFYEATGGGVTLSGGEPTLQMPFVAAFSQRCREEGLRVGLQTCGAFRWEKLSPHLPLFEFLHFDLKVMDPVAHKRATGADNALILANARKLASVGVPVRFRTPVVPGHTDTAENLAAIADFLLEIGVDTIHLLRYHAMGEAKLARLAEPISALDLGAGARRPEHLERASGLLRERGLEVTQ
jgi:pyruvate formate lyase activating enzyme